MEYNTVTNIQSCYIELPHLLYYSHIPTAVVALLLGILVIWKNKTITAKILFAISLSFVLWSYFDIVLWRTHSSSEMLFFWSLLPILDSVIIFGSYYFLHTFITKNDLSFKSKLAFFVLFLPVIFLVPTKLNLINFQIDECTATENIGFINYYLIFLGSIVVLLILNLLIRQYISQKNNRKQIILSGLGVILFLLSFFSTSYITSLFADYYSTNIEQYGLFGMVIFIAFLAYLIVRYKAFNIKLIATQALVVGLVILIGSQFFFIQNPTNKILNLITLTLALGFGYVLVKSVKIEVENKERLQSLSDELGVANDKLRQLDKAKSEFISIASHQLRTPLTSIKGFGSLLLEGTYGEVPEAQRGALEKIYISNERLIQLVEDLLNISRIEAGRMEFDFQEAQIEDLVQEAVQTLELSAKAKSLYLHWEKPAIAMPRLLIDVTKIKEVISNMVDNSIKYTQKGGITVKLETNTDWDSDHKEHKESVRVVVSDTGIGMDPEEVAMIFEKFQRGKQVAHYHTDGTGLGMYIGKKIVAEHKGRIWAESDGKGMGSRFILELPVS